MAKPTLQEIEIWKDVAGWEGLYEVSDFGRVRSRDRVMENGGAVGRYIKRGRILHGTADPNGYLQVSLCDDRGQQRRRVHTLVAGAFLGPRPVGLDVCHFNGNKSDNRSANLRYDTVRANLLDRHHQGKRWTRGSEMYNAKLTETDIPRVRELRAAGISYAGIGSLFGVNAKTIHGIINGKNWKHVA